MKYAKIFLYIFILFNTLNAKELKKVSLQLSWFNQFQFAGYFVGKEKGFYKDAGLNLNIKEFKFGINVPNEINENKSDFGIHRETLILERSNDKKLIALYALFQETPLILLSKKDSNINSVEDFYKKRIMMTKDDSSEVSIRAMISSKKIKYEDLKLIKHSHNIKDLVNNKTDIISAYISKAPYELKKLGVEYNVFNPKDYGFDMYSDYLFTNEQKIKTDLKSVLAFKNASLRSWEYAFSNIEETALLIFNKYNTLNLSLEELIFEGEELKKLAYASNVTLGNINLNKIQRSYDLYNIMGLVKNKVDIKKFVLEKQTNKLNFNFREINYINKKKIINVCTSSILKPYSYFEDNKYMGLSVDYIKLIEKKSKIKFNIIKTSSSDKLLEFFMAKKCEIVPSVGKTKERTSFSNFTNPYTNFTFVLVSNKDFPFVDNLKILKNKKIGISKNYSINSYIQKKYPQIDFVLVENINEGMKKVQNGSLDGHIDLLYVVRQKLTQNKFKHLKISAKIDKHIPISIAVNKDEKILLDILNKTINSISKNESSFLFDKWFTYEYKKEVDYTLMWQIIFFIGLIILALIYKQRMLKKMNISLKTLVEEKTKELRDFNHKLKKQVKEEVELSRKKDKILSKQAKLASMGEMLQNISHQWRQPLSIITTSASGLQIEKEYMGKINEEKLDKNLKNIIDTAMHLSNTIDDFMFFFKPNKIKKDFKIKEAIEKSINLFSPVINHTQIQIIKNIDDITINGFESEFIQVILNIINNAKDAFIYEVDKKMYLFIDIKKNKNNSIIITIKDNAKGIDENIINKIFEPYFTTKHKLQGTGIGLYMCQEILTQHMNGYIEVRNIVYTHDNTQCKGALFTIKLN